MVIYELNTVELDPRNPYPIAENVPDAPFPEGAGGIDPYHSFAHMFNGESVIQTNKEFIWEMESSIVTNYTRQSLPVRSQDHTSELIISRHLVFRLLQSAKSIL